MTREAHIRQRDLNSACCDLVADVARTHGTVRLAVAGASMVPVLWPGDLVSVERCDSSELRTDSIIVIRQNGKLIVHRFVHRADDRIVTRGDARPRNDEPVSASDVVGRVKSIQRDGRPVNAQPALWQRLAGAVLRRSELCTRLFLRLGPGFRRFGFAPAAFGTANPVRSLPLDM
jgi:hypothetical protein